MRPCSKDCLADRASPNGKEQSRMRTGKWRNPEAAKLSLNLIFKDHRMGQNQDWR